MKVQVGRSYVSRQGEIVNIVSEDMPKDGRRVFIDTIGRSYFENGEYYYADNVYSLVSEVV